MPEEKPISRDELKSLLLLVLLFVSVVGGREIGNYYSSYQEMTELKVLFEVTEEELSRYINALLMGDNPELEIGLIIANPLLDNSAEMVTSTPDYVNRWLVGLTVSPIVVNQPEASEVEIEMLIEDTIVDEAIYEFPRQKISYIQYTDRAMRLEIDDLEELREAIETATELYGGEAKITFRGRVHMHLLFLDTWLPFEVTRYPIVSPPYLEFIDSGWVSYTNGPVSSVSVNDGGYVITEFKNPTRIHSLNEEVSCTFFREGETEPIESITKNVQVAPNIEGQYTFAFQFEAPGNYTYRITTSERVLVDDSPVLLVE